MTGKGISNILYRIATESDNDNILDFMRKHYYPEEPLTLGNDPKLQSTEDEIFTVSLIPFGATIIALDEREQIVGCLLCGPSDPDEAASLYRESERIESTDKKWSEILRLLAYLEERANLYQRYNITKALYISALGVDRQMRGKSIGINLLERCFEMGKIMGYPLVSLDCTSIYSIRIAEQLQMDCVGQLAYSDYRDCNGRQLFRPPLPHTHIKTFAKVLK